MGLWVTGGCAALTHPTKPTSTLSLCPLMGALRLHTLQNQPQRYLRVRWWVRCAYPPYSITHRVIFVGRVSAAHPPPRP